jgi:hypothetical protein
MYSTERAGRFVESKSTGTESEGSLRLFWFIQKSVHGTQYLWPTVPYFQCDEAGVSLNVARKTVTTKRPEMLSSPTSEKVKMWQLLHAAMHVVPLLSHFSFSRGFVSQQCRSRNYPQDLKSQLPIRVISMTMFFSDGFNIFRSTGFYSDLRLAFLWFVTKVFKILQKEGHWNVMPTS